MSHTRKHTFTGNTDHDFTGLNPNTIPILDSAGTGLTNSAFSDVNGVMTLITPLQVYGDISVLGSAVTFNTTTVQALDNLIVLNYSGTHIAAAYGGIAVTSAKTNDDFAYWVVDSVGAWSANTPGTFTGLRDDVNGFTLKTINSAGTTTFEVKDNGVLYSGATPLQNVINTIVTGVTSNLQSGFSGWTASSGSNSIVANNGLNSISSGNYAIAGGTNNLASGDRSFIGNGNLNSATTQSSSVIGGSNNLSSGQASVIIGGAYNIASGGYSSVGGYRNSSLGSYSSVIAGNQNSVQSNNSSILGGQENLVTGNASTIVTGFNNKNTGNYSFIGGGRLNSATTTYSIAVGGKQNRASGTFSSIVGGSGNTASGTHSVVPGGKSNTAYGYASFAGGTGSTANGKFSFAFGSNSFAYGRGSVAIGYGAGANSATINNSNIAFGTYALAVGTNGNSIAIGYNALASSLGDNIAIGSNSTATVGAIAIKGTAAGNRSIAIKGNAIGAHSFSHGTGSYSVGEQSICISNSNTLLSQSAITYAPYSVILGGGYSTVNSNAIRSVIIGMSGFTATSADTVYVTNLYTSGYTDMNEQTVMPDAKAGRMFFSGSPLNRMIYYSGNTLNDIIIF